MILLSCAYDALDLAAAYGTSAAKGYFDFDSELYISALPVEVSQWSPGNPKIHRPPHGDEGAFFPTPDFAVEAVNFPLDRPSWTKFLCDELDRLHLSKDRYSSMLKRPHETTRLGYRLALISGKHFGVQSKEFAVSLAIVGIGLLGLNILFRPQDTCEICFRVAVSCQRRCEIHSQSKTARVSAQKDHVRQAQDARTGRLAASAIGWPKNRPLGLRWGYEAPFAVAGLLWESVPSNEGRWRSEIESALLASPLVRAKLPTNLLTMETGQLLAELRSAIDSQEWVSHKWPTKIVAAQTWFASESLVAPGGPPRGPRNKTSERLAAALEMFEKGSSRKDVASSLGISLSHLSHILKRHG